MSLWKIALAVWMGMYAFFALTGIPFKQQDVLMGICAALVVIFLVVEYRKGPVGQ